MAKGLIRQIDVEKAIKNLSPLQSRWVTWAVERSVRACRAARAPFRLLDTQAEAIRTVVVMEDWEIEEDLRGERHMAIVAALEGKQDNDETKRNSISGREISFPAFGRFTVHD